MKTLNFVPLCVFAAALFVLSLGTTTANAQQYNRGLGETTFVNPDLNQLEVIVGSSRRLKFGYKIPEFIVENGEIFTATGVAPSEILVTGLKSGVSKISVSDPDGNLQWITVHVTADTRKLEAAIGLHFPNSNITVHALQTGVLLKGTVARADDVNVVMEMAADYFPTTVINRMRVDGSQLVAIKVKVYDVSRSKLKTLGVDWAIFNDDFNIASGASGILQSVGLATGAITTSGNETISLSVLDDDTSFFKFMEALEQNNLAKLLDQPTLVAQNGRPAEFLSGGEIPLAVASGLGTNSIEFRPFGTKLDMVPLIHGQGELTLEVRVEVSEVDNSLSFGTGVPGFRVRRVNTGVRMKSGHTLALAGDYREETETEVRGIPFLMDSPLIGGAFRRTEDTVTESELVFLITPRFISEVDPTVLPKLGPGQLTTNPSRHELYGQAYVEVPRCNDDCPVNDRFDDPAGYGAIPNYAAPEQQNVYQNGVPVQNQNGFQQPGDVSSRNNLSGQTPAIEYQTIQQSSAPTNTNSGTPAAGFGWPQGN